MDTIDSLRKTIDHFTGTQKTLLCLVKLILNFKLKLGMIYFFAAVSDSTSPIAILVCVQETKDGKSSSTRIRPLPKKSKKVTVKAYDRAMRVI